jgi:hypothetical protein
MDNLSYLIILRALFIYYLVNAGWSIKSCKNNKNTFKLYKNNLNK